MKVAVMSDRDALKQLKLRVPDIDETSITTNQAVEMLQALQGDSACKEMHIDADDILCRLLWSLGRRDVVIAWEKVGKWYA